MEKLLLFSLSLLLDKDDVSDDVGEAPRFTVSAPNQMTRKAECFD